METLPEITATQPIFSGFVFDVRRDTVRFTDGSSTSFDVVEHPGSFAVAARPAPGELVLVRQYRHPLRSFLWEIPAGTAHHGEDPLEGAARELAEETGYRAGKLRQATSFYVSPGFLNECMHLVVADELVAGEQSLDPDERIDVHVFPIKQALDMLARGEILDAKTTITLLMLASGRL